MGMSYLSDSKFQEISPVMAVLKARGSDPTLGGGEKP